MLHYRNNYGLNGFQGVFNILMGSFTNAGYVAGLLKLTKTI